MFQEIPIDLCVRFVCIKIMADVVVDGCVSNSAVQTTAPFASNSSEKHYYNSCFLSNFSQAEKEYLKLSIYTKLLFLPSLAQIFV